MAKNRFYKVDEMFEMVSWTQHEKNLFINLLIDFKGNGKLIQDGIQSEPLLIEISSRLSNELGKNFTVEKVVKKLHHLSSRFDLWEVLFNWPGVKWNAVEDKFEADATTWDAIFKAYPYVKKYKHQSEPLWVHMDIIFGQVKRIENLKKSQKYVHDLMKLCKPTAELIINYEDRDADISLKDEQSVVGRVRHVLPLSAPSVYDPSFGLDEVLVGTSHVGMKMAMFDDDYGSQNSHISSIGSCMWP